MTTGCTIQHHDTVYVRNMAALFRADGQLAQIIDECEDDGSVAVEPSRRGPPTVAVRVPGSDRPLYLHSRVDPAGEAKRIADAVEVGDSFCYIISGFGLGHHVKALAERLKGDAFVIVAEPNLQVLRAAMEHVDLVDLLAGGRCMILTRPDKGMIQTRLEPRNNLMMIAPPQLVSHPPSERLAPEFHTAMRTILKDHIAYCKMCLVTLVANSRLTNRNVANNLPRYLMTPPIDVLRDRFKGRPAVVIAAGPSLRRNIDQLAELRGRAVLIAVQTVFKMLLDRGIPPDFVTSLDYHEMSKRFFEGVADFGHTHLVAEPKVTWHVVDTYRGRISLLNNDFARLVLGDRLAHRGGLKAGATVAHLAFYLAVYMGCEPIVLVGQDLGYSHHVYYTPGVAFHDIWRPDLNRFSTVEMKEWERIARHRKILFKAKDIYGHDIYTDEQLFTYLQQFEGDFSAVPGRVIDATEGGIRKAGTQPMPLSEVADRYCREPIPPELFAYRDQLNWCDRSRLAAGKGEVEARLKECETLVETCRKMIAVLKELSGLVETPKEFNRRIAEVDQLRLQVRAQEHTYRMVSSVSQHAELQRFAADRRIGATNLDSKELARRQLDRDIRFVEAMIEGAEALQEILRECRDRFEAAITEGEA